MSTKQQLVAAIEAAPDDPAGYLVLGDWLQQQGDPRGELIMLQHAGRDDDADALFDDHLDAWWGPLADKLDLTMPFGSGALGAPTKWRWGFLESLWISNKFAHDPDRVPSGKPKPELLDIPELVGDMLDHASARFLRKLAVGIVWYRHNEYDRVVQAIARRPRPMLDTLVLGDFYYEETELNWSRLGKVDPMCEALPNLRSLTLRSSTVELRAIDYPKLETFSFIGGELDAESAIAVANARWPALHTLALQLGNYVGVDEIRGILEGGERFPRLRHLGVGNCSRSDEVAIQLAGSPIAAQLESLDFSDGTLGDEGARALAEAKASFPGLRSIDVDQCYLSEEGLALLRTLCEVHETGQRDDGGDPDDRYINAYE